MQPFVKKGKRKKLIFRRNAEQESIVVFDTAIGTARSLQAIAYQVFNVTGGPRLNSQAKVGLNSQTAFITGKGPSNDRSALNSRQLFLSMDLFEL